MEDLRNLLKTMTSVQNIAAGLIEALADALELTNDPKALLNAFRQNTQHQSENTIKHIPKTTGRQDYSARRQLQHQGDGGSGHRGHEGGRGHQI